MSSKNPKHEAPLAEIATVEEEPAPEQDGSALARLLAAQPRPTWPEGPVIATCTEDRHPTLAGRVRVRCENAHGHVCQAWVATLNGLVVRVLDRVLVLKLPHEIDPIVIGVVDGFSRRAEAPKRLAQVLELKRDETLQVNAESGQPLLQIVRNQQGPLIRLLQTDTQIDFAGKLCLSAEAIEMRARQGAVRIDASDDVEIVGEAIHLN